MADATILYPEQVVELVIKSGTQVSKGDLLGYSSGWVLADADAATNIYAQYIALQGMVGDGSSKMKACKKCELYDSDAPYTANSPYYVSGTAGAITATRPATDGDLIQIVGRALDTSRCLISIKEPQEFEMFLSPDVYDTSSEPGLGKADTGYPGIELTGTETCYFKGRFPSGLVGDISAARLVGNSVNASAGDIDVTVVGAYDGDAATPAANNQDTGTALTGADWVQADADNKILWVDVSSCFDSGFYKPGRTFGVLVDPDGITGALQILGLYIRGFKV